MDLTWTFYQYGWGVRFIPEAVSYPIEPHDLRMMRIQLRRWSHGLVQNLKLHWSGVLKTQFLRHSLGIMVWDATIATAAYFLFLPLIAIYLGQPWPLLGYLIDIPIVLVPVLAAARPRGEIRLALLSVPGFLVLRVVNAIHFIEAVWSEIIRGKRFNNYVKGH
jgi:biofilm PGA synthesis N-glycosyltransferase PgaC